MRYFLVTINFIMMILKLLKLYLNKIQREKGLPQELKMYYSQIQYKRWRKYEEQRDMLTIIRVLFLFGLRCIFYLSSFFEFISGMFSYNVLLNSIGMILIVYSLENIFEVIFDFIEVFTLEEKSCINKTRFKFFVYENIKDYITDIFFIAVVIVLIHFVFWFAGFYGFIILLVCLLLVVDYIQNNSLNFLKLYNQYKPLEDSHLKNRIMDLVKKNGFKIKGIYIIDTSNSTNRANAFCIGDIEKEICIDDNLFKHYSDNEILSVFSHELGHAVMNHSRDIKKMIFLKTIVLFFIFSIIFMDKGLYADFYIYNLNYCMILVLLKAFSELIIFLLDIPYYQMLRKNELKADCFAAKCGYGLELKNILIKLSRNSLSENMVHPIAARVLSTHPTLIDRIKNIEKTINYD